MSFSLYSKSCRLYAPLFTLILCFLIHEIGLRIMGHTPSNVTEGLYEEYHDSFRLKKNITKVTTIPAYTYTIHTNSFGFRDKRTGERDIYNNDYNVFLGASEVFANGVNFEDTFVGIFDAYASMHNIEVLNMATGGHYFLDQEYLLKEFLRSHARKPSRLFFCINDLHVPKFDMINNHLRVINGYVFPENEWFLPLIRLTLGNISSSYCYFRDGIRRAQAKWFDYKISNDSRDFIELYSSNNRMRDPDMWRRFEAYIDNFNSYCRNLNVELILIYLPIIDSFNLHDYVIRYGMDPSNFSVSFYDDSIKEYCKKRKIKYVTCRPILQKHFNEGKQLRFALDPHYNIFANRVIGDYLTSQLF